MIQDFPDPYSYIIGFTCTNSEEDKTFRNSALAH